MLLFLEAFLAKYHVPLTFKGGTFPSFGVPNCIAGLTGVGLAHLPEQRTEKLELQWKPGDSDFFLSLRIPLCSNIFSCPIFVCYTDVVLFGSVIIGFVLKHYVFIFCILLNNLCS